MVMDERNPVPCFKCCTEPRMPEHVVCTSCHREETCPRCHPELKQYVPDTVLNLPRDPHRRREGSAW